MGESSRCETDLPKGKKINNGGGGGENRKFRNKGKNFPKVGESEVAES